MKNLEVAQALGLVPVLGQNQEQIPGKNIKRKKEINGATMKKLTK